MTRLNKSLMLLLLICMVGYSSAWAFESCVVEIEDVNAAIHMVNEQNTEQATADSDLCNHLCHAFAHMVAICEQSEYSLSASVSIKLANLPQYFTSLILTPDDRPPIV